MSAEVKQPAQGLQEVGRAGALLTAHLVERYGKDEVLKWYFEVWNEPDIDYWHATPEDYFKLYDYAVAGVRAALPDAKVGGPASTGPGREKADAFLKNFLDHVNSARAPPTANRFPWTSSHFMPRAGRK